MGCAFGEGTDPSFAVGRGQTLRWQLIQKSAQLEGVWGQDPSFAVGRGQTLRRQLIQKSAQLGLWEGTDP